MKAEKKVRECGCHGLGQPIKKERRPKLRELSAVLQYPDPHLKILKSIKGDEIENYLILFIEHCFSVIYVISYNLIAFSHFARYLADVGKMWGKYLVVSRKIITFVPRFPHHQ